jgi:DNA repair protein RadC
MEQVKQYKVAEIKVAYKRCLPDIAVKINDSHSAYKVLKLAFNNNTIGMQEQFVVAYVNQASDLLGLYRASSGGVTGTVADIRIILAIGLKLLSTGIILAHNHPSGNLRASKQDEELTRKIMESGKLMDIKLLDHLIISPAGHNLSFADEGLM